MSTERKYNQLPFSWNNLETEQNDLRWLDSIIRNAARFSDWWTKAKIVQLAYDNFPKATTELEMASAEQEIVEHLKHLCSSPTQYRDFYRYVNQDFVIETLNCWKSQTFTQAISRNFEIYADCKYPNTFLVTSTTAVSLDVDRQLPPLDRYIPLFNVDELAQLITERKAEQLTLRTHGYSNPAQGFYKSFAKEAQVLNQPHSETNSPTLQPDHFYIGYQWPSEQPFFSPGLWADYHTHLGIVFKFLFVLGVVVSILTTLLVPFLKWLIIPLFQVLGFEGAPAHFYPLANFETQTDFALLWWWITPTVFILWLLAFLLLRIIVYQRDRYRAIHYGAPDLAEFFWRLDKAIPLGQRLNVNLIGHSMGGLLLVNVLRILTEQFGKDDRGSLQPDSTLVEQQSSNTARESDDIGEHLSLDKLILASPDIPLELLREGRNNYVRSAMRRCRRIYLMSSDRDVVLRYLATVSNWMSEPSIQMAGMRLGNIYLKQVNLTDDSYRPYVRIMVNTEAAVNPTSAYDLFRKFNYLDCSEMKGVNGVPLPLNPLTGIIIDLINALLYIFATLYGKYRLDVHGGYFITDTISFDILKFLLSAKNNQQTDKYIKDGIENIIQNTTVRFLPSKPWIMPTSNLK